MNSVRPRVSISARFHLFCDPTSRTHYTRTKKPQRGPESRRLGRIPYAYLTAIALRFGGAVRGFCRLKSVSKCLHDIRLARMRVEYPLVGCPHGWGALNPVTDVRQALMD